MKRMNFLIGMAGISLVLGMMVIGCDQDGDSGGGYTIEFKVDYSGSYLTTYQPYQIISNVEFLNGSNRDAPVLQKETVRLSYGEMTGVYKVSGFTEKDGDDNRIYGVAVWYEAENGEPQKGYFEWSSTSNNDKVLVVVGPFQGIQFRDGNW
jgi:hypothetical protein